MKNLLIVEDNKIKLDEMKKLLRDHLGEVVFGDAPSIANAYANLELQKWDLVILDMTFQVSQGIGQAVQKEGLAGIELLQYMTAKGIAFPVVVATQHSEFSHNFGMSFSSIEELHAALSAGFPRIYKGTVKIDLANSNWHNDFLRAVNGAIDVG